MIKMKKIMVLFSAFIFAVIGMANVKAIHVVESNGNLQSGIGYSGSNVTVTENGGVYTLTLTGNAKQDLIIQSGEKVILDLGSHTFENYCVGSNCSGFSSAAITILDGGTLTIKGSGTVKLQSSSSENGYSAIDNAGTLIIEGGNFSAEKKGTAAIHNSGTLTFNAGTVKTNTAGAWGITNTSTGTTTINDGTFEQGNDFSVLLNEGTLTINDGDFKTTGSSGHNALITTVNSGSTTITDGDFNVGTDGITFYSGTQTPVGETNVVGGHFSNNSSVESLLENTIYTINSNGDVVLREADYSNLNGALSVAKGLDTSNASAESIKALEEAIENAENVEKGLKANEQYQIDELTKALTTAIANLKERTDDAVKPGTDNTDNSEEKAPNTFDAGLTYVGLALSAVGASVVSIKKLRNN